MSLLVMSTAPAEGNYWAAFDHLDVSGQIELVGMDPAISFMVASREWNAVKKGLDDQFPHVTYWTDGAQQKHECVICMDETEDPLSLPCAHTFCAACIRKWGARAKQCPVCKESFSKKHIV